MSSGFQLDAVARRIDKSAPHAVRLRFARPNEVSISLINAKPGIEWDGDGTQRVEYVPGQSIDYAGLMIDLVVTGEPDGRVWRIEALSEDRAIDRVLARVRVDKQQHQPGTLGLTVVDADARRAAAIATSLAKSFVQRDIAEVTSRANAKVAYLEEQLASRREALAALETERERILASNPDAVAPQAARIELAQREGAWDDRYRQAHKKRMAAEGVVIQLANGTEARTALAALTTELPPEVAALLGTLREDEQRLRAVARGSQDTGYRRTLLLKADDYTLEAQTFETTRRDLHAIVERLKEG